MQIRVIGRHVQVSDEVRQYLQDKADKLPRFYDRIHDVEVVLDHDKDQFTAEMVVHVDRKNTFVAKGSGPDTFVLIDQVVDKIERQLTKHKEKNRIHKHGTYTDPATEAGLGEQESL